MSAENNQYSERSTVFLIDGYYFPCPTSPDACTPEAAFETARKQLIDRLERQIEKAKSMSCERFLELKVRGI